jgi:ribosomal protein S18
MKKLEWKIFLFKNLNKNLKINMNNKKNKECYFCVNNLEVDYKDVRTLRRLRLASKKISHGN